MLSFGDAISQMEKLKFPVGIDASEKLVTSDLNEISHLLVAGASGTGKSVFINSCLLSLISNNGPESLRLVLCDTKMVEFFTFRGIQHLLIPVCTDARKIHGALQWVAIETEKRLRDFSTAGKKSILSYNDYTWENFLSDIGLPQIVVVVDDFASALLEQPEMANSIRTILLNGRTTGVHLIFSTQTPTWKAVKRISTLFRSKVLFPVASKDESIALIGSTAAFSVGGRGNAVYSNGCSLTIVKSFLADAETSSGIIEKAKAIEPFYSEEIIGRVEQFSYGNTVEKSPHYEDVEGDDELLPAAIEVVLDMGQASVSMLQRRLKLGYGRAARLVDQMEEKGVVGPFEGSRPRQLLITKEQWWRMAENPANSSNNDLVECQPPAISDEICEDEEYRSNEVETIDIEDTEDSYSTDTEKCRQSFPENEEDNNEPRLIQWFKQEMKLQKEYQETVKRELQLQKELRNRRKRGLW